MLGQWSSFITATLHRREITNTSSSQHAKDLIGCLVNSNRYKLASAPDEANCLLETAQLYKVEKSKRAASSAHMECKRSEGNSTIELCSIVLICGIENDVLPVHGGLVD